MPSTIDPTKPVTGNPTTQSVRDQFAAAVTDINAILANLATLASANTGDETTASIKTKLSISTLSGANTGDEDTASIKTKLGISTLSGSNTGDETTASIKTKLSISTLSGANTGDEDTASIKTKLGISTLSGSNTGDEDTASIKSKLGISTLSGSNTGDDTTTPADVAAMKSAWTSWTPTITPDAGVLAAPSPISMYYKLTGKTLFLRMLCNIAITSGTPTGFTISLPLSLTARNIQSHIELIINAGAFALGYSRIADAANTLRFALINDAAMTSVIGIRSTTIIEVN